MGFFKKLGRAAGKLGKLAVRYAPQVAGAIGGGPIGAIAASKLRSLGENRTKQKLQKGLLVKNLGETVMVKKLTRSTPVKGGPRVNSPGLPALIAMRDPATRELLAGETAKGVKSRIVANVSNKQKAARLWKGLDEDTRSELLKQFKASNPKGTDAAWAQYVIANA